MTLPQQEVDVRWYEGVFAGVTKRIDYTNRLLGQLIELQGGAPPSAPSWLQQLLSAIDKLTVAINNLSIGGVLANRETFMTGQKDITTAGTAVELSTSPIPIPDGFWLTVIAKPGNTGTIYIGSFKGDAEGGMKFDGLSPGLAVSLRVNNVNLVWVNSDTDSDGVSWIVER